MVLKLQDIQQKKIKQKKIFCISIIKNWLINKYKASGAYSFHEDFIK